MKTTPARPTPAETSRALTRVRRGVSIDPLEAEALLAARGEALDELLALAGAVRDRGLEAAGRPKTITWSPKVFIPLTRLCRDRCAYCTFATDPASLRRGGHGMFLSPEEVLDIARAGAGAGCLEALFTLGDRPEERWPAAREWLESRGYDNTLAYVRAMSILVLEETGMLPHLNPGVMSWEEMSRLKPVAPSMGMMLETTSERLFRTPGEAHYGSPDKDPAVRLRALEDAGRLAIPFTTGLLLGIGETPAERIDALFALRRIGRTYGHIQEVIIQNFRAKPDTAMRGRADLGIEEYAAAVATARIVLGPKFRLQAPPNLTDLAELGILVRAGIDDWGGVSPVTPDHVNPERAWPNVDALAAVTAEQGFGLRARLTAHPEYVLRADPWLDPRVAGHVARLAGPDGLAREPRRPVGMPWQEPDDIGGYAGFAARNAGGRVDLNVGIDLTGRSQDKRGDFDEVYGDWVELARRGSDVRAGTRTADSARPPGPDAVPHRLVPEAREALRLAHRNPAALADPSHADKALTLMMADGEALNALCHLADDVRRDVVGDDVTYVVNRNINFTNVCYTGCRFCAFAQRKSDADAFTLSLEQIAERVREAAAAGATEICMQGGIHPDLPGTAYFDLARAVKAAVPGIHLHAFSPMEIVNGATRSGMSIRDWLVAAKEAGVDTIPGTAAEILDDDIRWTLTKGKLPAAMWLEVVGTAHDVGLKSSSTMMYGHVDHPGHWVAHLRTLRAQQEHSGGFTEFVALPFIHFNAPVYLAGIARPGPTQRDNRAVHAMARLMLHGAIDNIQCSWVKLGDRGCLEVLAGGVNDLGGTLMEETISRMAGSENGSAKTVAELRALAAAAGRTPRQRSTDYLGVRPQVPSAAAGVIDVSDAEWSVVTARSDRA